MKFLNMQISPQAPVPHFGFPARGSMVPLGDDDDDGDGDDNESLFSI